MPKTCGKRNLVFLESSVASFAGVAMLQHLGTSRARPTAAAEKDTGKPAGISAIPKIESSDKYIPLSAPYGDRSR